MGRLSVGGVVSALRVLLDDVSEALVLFYVGDLSVEAIAAETGSPPGTVQARLHRGRQRLAPLLTPHDPVTASREENNHDPDELPWSTGHDDALRAELAKTETDAAVLAEPASSRAAGDRLRRRRKFAWIAAAAAVVVVAGVRFALTGRTDDRLTVAATPTPTPTAPPTGTSAPTQSEPCSTALREPCHLPLKVTPRPMRVSRLADDVLFC